MALSSMGHSQASAQSLQSIAGPETERKISFVLHEPENVSGGSNVTVRIGIYFMFYFLQFNHESHSFQHTFALFKLFQMLKL